MATKKTLDIYGDSAKYLKSKLLYSLDTYTNNMSSQISQKNGGANTTENKVFVNSQNMPSKLAVAAIFNNGIVQTQKGESHSTAVIDTNGVTYQFFGMTAKLLAELVSRRIQDKQAGKPTTIWFTTQTSKNGYQYVKPSVEE